MYGLVEAQRQNGELFVYLRDKLKLVSDDKVTEVLSSILETDLDHLFVPIANEQLSKNPESPASPESPAAGEEAGAASEEAAPSAEEAVAARDKEVPVGEGSVQSPAGEVASNAATQAKLEVGLTKKKKEATITL